MKNLLLTILLLTAVIASAQKQMSLEDATIGRYTYLNPEKLTGLAWKNDRVFSFVDNDTLWISNADKDEKKPVIDLSGINRILNNEADKSLRIFPDYSWVSDEIIRLNTENGFFAVNLDENKVEYRVELPQNDENGILNSAGKFAAYTIGDDLFVNFSSGRSVQITNDGGNGIVNGKTVHRNEFGISKGIFDSPEGNFIAFYRKDESMVTDYPLVDYMGRVAEHTPVKYPMAGMNSHHVTVGIYCIATGKTVFLKTGEPEDHYLTNIAWSPDEKFLYMAELNREQNHMSLNCYDIFTGEKVRTLFEEKDDKYVEPLHPVIFSKVNSDEFYYLSREDGWFHVSKYNIYGKRIKQIIKGEWEVTRILGFDPKEKFMFFEGTKESPLEINIYSVNIKSGKTERLTKDSGVHEGLLSPGGNYMIDSYSATDIPAKTDLISSDGEFHRTVHKADDPLEKYKLGENRIIKIRAADDETDLYGRLILPPDFDSSKKYPVIIYVYGGPHLQLVTKNWHNDSNWWQYYMASKGFIAFTLDNRGSKNRGRDFETVVHRQLGVAETEDQMKGIEYLKSLPYVDAGRIGVHGWSFGGFMTLNLMLRHPEVFKVGVAGGPVVDWSMYEVMYGERYMDTPEENPDGYTETNIINYVPSLQGKLMLIHGMQDDVVVMQHSIKFLRECVIKGKQVDFFVYPVHPHNVRGRDRLHLMEKISNYFFDNL